MSKHTTDGYTRVVQNKLPMPFEHNLICNHQQVTTDKIAHSYCIIRVCTLKKASKKQT